MGNVRKRKKKFKLKKKVIIIFFIMLLGLLFISPFMFVRIKLFGDNKIKLDYGEEYSESGYRAYMFNKNITSKIKVSDNIDSDIGKYKVIYSYKFLFYNIKKIRTINVSDISGPIIKLNGEEAVEVTIDTEYNELGYEAIDNVDGDVSDKVTVTNDIDTSKIGDYQVVYEVSDNAGNKSKLIRKVRVEKRRPTQMSIEEYTLDGWYDSVKLKETKDYGEDYFDSITMVGDSNTMNMYLNGFLDGIRAWAVPCLHAEAMHYTDINLYGLGSKMRVMEAVIQYKPERMIINFGTFSTTWISEDIFIEKANSILDQVKEESPDTEVILISLYPIRKGNNINSFTQEVINKYNFLILEMAYNHGYKYLDVQEVLKGEDGYGMDKYFVDDKFHLTYLGHSVVKNYIKTHALEEE